MKVEELSQFGKTLSEIPKEALKNKNKLCSVKYEQSSAGWALYHSF